MNVGLILLLATVLALLAVSLVNRRRRAGSMESSKSPGWVPWVMQITVSVIVLAAAVYIILSGKYNDGTQKFAFGAVGTVLGFWLKPLA
jgi:hypothetical protein